MSAVIQNEYTQNDTTTVLRNFTFPYLKTSDIKVSLDGVETTAFTLANATTIQFNTAPANGAKIKIFRQTSVDNLTATLQKLEDEMFALAKKMEFEKAAICRDKIKFLKRKLIDL